MNARLALALALALALPAAAGCLQAPDFLRSSGMEVTAQANLAKADEAAKAWNAAAELVGIGTIETAEAPREADIDGDGTSEDEIPQDPDVGNGLARVWWYAYDVDTAEGSSVRVWRVLADGTVEAQDDSGFGSELGASGFPLGEWETDSDSAIDMAKTNGTFLSAIAGENATIVHILVHEDMSPAWRVVGVSRAGIAVAEVDAKTGELLAVHTFDMGAFTMPTTEGFAPYAATERKPYVDVADEGELAPGDVVEFPFEVPDEAVGMIHLAAQGRTPMDGVRFEVVDSAGDVVQYGSAYGGFWGEGEHEDELELEAGSYTLILEYADMAPMTPVGLSGAQYAYRLFLGPPGLEMHDDE